MRKIIVDGDACPAVIKQEIVDIAGNYDIPVVFVVSISHDIWPAGAEVVRVDNLPEAVDMAVANRVSGGDIVVTQDYGLAALVLAKGARCLSPRGLVYTEENIDGLLFRRHLSAVQRRSGRARIKGPRAFSKADCRNFSHKLRQLIEIGY
ncbi:MAG: DUF188 domain-containing protein [Thermoanaerobacteraceae bacterium]|nr:DUF188 domain-containing protein [Thermoanaerobacteraceae bacterium]